MDSETTTPADATSTLSSTASTQYDYPESHESQDPTISQARRVTYTEMGRVIKFMNLHNETSVSCKNISVLVGMETSLLARWKNVLHEATDREGKASIEDRRLTAVLGMAIGHTRRLCARFIEEATEMIVNRQIDSELNHATELELACINTWIHEENSQVNDGSDLSDGVIEIRAVNHSGGEETDVKDIPQPPSRGAAGNKTIDSEASEDGDEVEEPSPTPKSGCPEGDGKRQGKKGNGGTIPKITEQASHSNQSTPKTARKQTLMQDNLLGQFISEVEDMSQDINRAIMAWDKNKSARQGKKTTANLEMMRAGITDKLLDVNETWAEMANNGNGNKTTRSALSRAVRGATNQI